MGYMVNFKHWMPAIFFFLAAGTLFTGCYTIKQGTAMLDLVEPVITNDKLEQMRAEVDQIHVDPALMEYIVTLIGRTRQYADIVLGASPRASIALTSISKAAV